MTMNMTMSVRKRRDFRIAQHLPPGYLPIAWFCLVRAQSPSLAGPSPTGCWMGASETPCQLLYELLP